MRRFAWMWAVVAAGCLTSATAAQQAKPAEKPFSVNVRLPKSTQASLWAIHAEELQAKGNLAGAAKAFQTAAELTPEDYLLWDRAGWAHLDQADAKAALAAFQQGRKSAPAGAPASGGMLIAQYAQGDRAAVEAELKRLLPENRVAAALPVVTKSLAAAQRTPEWSYGLGYLYARVLGNSPRGIGPLEDVVEKQPQRAEAWLLLVDLHRELGNGPQEDAAAVKYLDLQPESVDSFRLRAQRFTDLQQFANAVSEYQDGLKKYPEAGSLRFALARVQERSGDAKAAEATLRQAVTEAGTQSAAVTEARAQLAQFHARQGRYEDAARYYSEAASQSGATAATWSTWGSLLALSDKWEEAARALEGAAQREESARGTTLPAARDELLTARYRAAVCRLAAGQKEQAKSGLAAALMLKNDARTSPEAEAAAFLAWMEGASGKSERLAYQRSDERWAAFTWRKATEEGEFEVRGRFSPAAMSWKAILQQVQKRSPECWPADYALARLSASGGYTQTALELLAKVTSGRSDWWAGHFAVGQYYARERNRELGVPALRRVVQLAPDCRSARVTLSLLSGVKDEEEDP